MRLLRDAGLNPTAVDAVHVRVKRGSVLRVELRSRAPYVGEVAACIDTFRNVLVVVPSMSEATAAALDSAAISYVDMSGRVSIEGGRLTSARSGRSRRASRSRTSAAKTAILRSFLRSTEPSTQAQLAALAGVSQPRVSRILDGLQTIGLVQCGASGWEATDRHALLAAAELAAGAWGTIELYWYGLDSPLEQVRELARNAVGRVAVSGEVGADLVAPWRAPTTALVYTDPLVDPSLAGLAPVDRKESATLVQRIPLDRSAFSATITNIDGVDVEIADPVQIIFDLVEAGGADRAEAAQRLRRVVTP